MREWEKLYAEKRQRRWNDPNYVVTLEDRVDDFWEFVVVGSLVALVGYGIYRWIKPSEQN